MSESPTQGPSQQASQPNPEQANIVRDMQPIGIYCDDDKGIESVTLKEFPCMPMKGDKIIISGVNFEVVERVFVTNNGTIDGSVQPPTVVLKKLR